MKKFISMGCIVILLSLTAFSSCIFDNSKKAERVLDKITSAMNGADSYEINSDAEILTYVSAEKMKIEVSSKEIYLEEENDELYYYSKSDTTIKFRGEETATSSMEAFCDGEYYFKYALGDKDTKLRSTHTKEEFLNSQKQERNGTNLLTGYSKIVYTKNDDGTHTVTLSEYNEKHLKYANAYYGLPQENAGGRIVDFCVKIITNSKYLINEVKIDYVFSNTEFSGSEKLIFSKYNKAEREADALNPLNHIEVSDAMAVRTLATMIKDKTESNNDSFAFTYELSAGNEKIYQEKFDVAYGADKGKYYFGLEGTIEGEKQRITYKDGECSSNGEILNSEYDDFRAKQIVDSIIDPFSFIPTGITDIKKEESGNGVTHYEIEFYPPYTHIDEALKSIVGKYESASIIVKFSVGDNELKTFEYDLKAVTKSGMFLVTKRISTKADFGAFVNIESIDAL